MTSREGLFVRGIPGDVSILAPPPKPKKPEPKAVQYRAPPELMKEIDAAAKRAGISRNEAMTQFLKFALEADKKLEQSKKRGSKEH